MTTKQMTRRSSLLLDVDKFAHAQRVGQMLTSSTMVPEHFRNNLGNCVIALNYADRVGLDPFMAMQKMYVIHGKPAIETQLQIALFNKNDAYSHIQYKLSGTGDNQQCIAYATDIETSEEIEGPAVSIDMAKKEGWYQKKGSKWQTMPELMLRYRAAAFFIRLYAPETTLGLSTMEEMVDMDMKNITPAPAVKIETEANQEVVDIKPAEAEAEIEPATMTEEEKAEIIKQEQRGPEF